MSFIEPNPTMTEYLPPDKQGTLTGLIYNTNIENVDLTKNTGVCFMKMKSIILGLALLAVCSVLFAGMLPSDEVLQNLEDKVDSLMAAYNEQDAKAFYTDWAKSMAAITSPEMFRMIFTDKHMKKHGKYISRELIADECSVADGAEYMNGLLVYEAVFENNERIKLSINLIKEEGEWKFQQVDMNPIR
jgi:hypothetical protein